MTAVLLGLLAIILLGALLEQRRARLDRAKLEHVVHVNGIRGKSTVTRLIAAGLQAGGLKVFCKTTGTLPMVITTGGVEQPWRRSGKANIKEQLSVLHRAAHEGAQVLVVECMAVDPALQAVTQHQMLQSDIGVITNVRLDHTAEMGETAEEICDSLSNTIPKSGVLFTADSLFFGQLSKNAVRLGCKVQLALPDGSEPDFDFPENLALAAAVCRHLGVDEQTAFSGMLHYRKDPYALSIHRLPQGGGFINGMSINDPQSTEMVCCRVLERMGWQQRRLILLINNRPDRGYRTRHMVMVAKALCPSEVWLLGASQLTVSRAIRRDLPEAALRRFSRADDLPLNSTGNQSVIFAVGNVAGQGHPLMERIKKEAAEYVQ